MRKMFARTQHIQEKKTKNNKIQLRFSRTEFSRLIAASNSRRWSPERGRLNEILACAPYDKNFIILQIISLY